MVETPPTTTTPCARSAAEDEGNTNPLLARVGRCRETLALADELQTHPFIAHCRLGLGKLDRRAGKREQAQEHLTTAMTMYREMDMHFYLEQAKAAVAELV